MRSGDIELYNSAGTFRNAGSLAVDWSSRAAEATGAYRLVVYAVVYPSGDTTNFRHHGFPLRWEVPRRGADFSLLLYMSNTVLRQRRERATIRLPWNDVSTFVSR